MEIGYSNFELDTEIFLKNEVIGLVDKNSNFIYNRIYGINKMTYNSSYKVSTFLGINGLKKKKLSKNLKDGFGITKDIERKTLNTLSSSELIKVLILKASLLDTNVIILNHIDAYFNERDLKDIFICLKRNKESIGKTIIFSTNKVDNIISNTNYYVITSENRIIYNGNDINTIKEKTHIMDFVDIANKKGAKLQYYKDANDLLKAIYRSVR